MGDFGLMLHRLDFNWLSNTEQLVNIQNLSIKEANMNLVFPESSSFLITQKELKRNQTPSIMFSIPTALLFLLSFVIRSSWCNNNDIASRNYDERNSSAGCNTISTSIAGSVLRATINNLWPKTLDRPFFPNQLTGQPDRNQSGHPRKCESRVWDSELRYSHPKCKSPSPARGQWHRDRGPAPYVKLLGCVLEADNICLLKLGMFINDRLVMWLPRQRICCKNTSEVVR